jgi:hypothetical protein
VDRGRSACWITSCGRKARGDAARTTTTSSLTHPAPALIAGRCQVWAAGRGFEPTCNPPDDRPSLHPPGRPPCA